ncbi:extracellular solute-binding protein [Cohnella algarum]|uniref:extracellular solute-binding protein n=1 Tax=Cohnella algarum TaxID=2044859 RepID=UPI0023DDDB43|nr:extracellular solute-binding protein [Cohnella algarum]
MPVIKKLSAAVAIAVLSAVVAACAPDRGEAIPTGESATDAAKPAKLVVWANDDANHLKAVEQIAQKYAEQTGIEVEVTPVSGAEQVQKLALAAPSGKGPDLFYQPQDRLGDVVAQGLADPVELDGEAAGATARRRSKRFATTGKRTATRLRSKRTRFTTTRSSSRKRRLPSKTPPTPRPA